MSIINYNWVAFFSQTGTEVANIMQYFNVVPSAIITNRQSDDGVHPYLLLKKSEGMNWITLPTKPELKDYRKALKGFDSPLITLHGYLRIIPKEICKKYTIFNLHPGLITQYPELKGKDPQKRAYELGHSVAGAVIHKVIPAVDEGEIVQSHAINIKGLSEDQVYHQLHCLGSIMWYGFFKNYNHINYEHRRNSKNNRKTIPGNVR